MSNVFDHIPSYISFVPNDVEDEYFGFGIGQEMIKDATLTVYRSMRDFDDEAIATASNILETNWWLKSLHINTPDFSDTIDSLDTFNAFYKILSFAHMRYLKLIIECLQDDINNKRQPEDRMRTKSIKHAGDYMEILKDKADLMTQNKAWLR